MGMVKLLFSFHGRINRAQYWLGGLITFAVLVVAVLAAIALFANHGEAAILPVLLGMGALYVLCVWCGTSLNVKRLHDRGRTGYIALLAFVPALIAFQSLMNLGSATPMSMLGAGLLTNLATSLINIYFLVDLGMMPSAPGPNQHGDPPRPGSAFSSFPTAPSGPSASMFGAENAVERAIAAQSRSANAPTVKLPPITQTLHPSQPVKPPTPQAPPMASPANANAPKAFGRRAT